MRRLVSSRAGIPLRVARQGEPLVAIVPSLGGQPLPLSLLTALIKILMDSQGFKSATGPVKPRSNHSALQSICRLRLHEPASPTCTSITLLSVATRLRLSSHARHHKVRLPPGPLKSMRLGQSEGDSYARLGSWPRGGFMIGWILFGLFVGIVAKLVMPGKDPGGFTVTILLGIGGAFVGGYLGRSLGW